MSTTRTRDVEISVRPRFHPEHSEPHRDHWFFSYTVRVHNLGLTKVQILARTWHITDARGHTEVVRGPGVIGEQPIIEPGEHFVYTSYCPLGTSLGAMEGSYTIRLDDGEVFEARINPFTLVDPDQIH